MKITRKSAIVVGVVLALAVVTTQVAAASGIVELQRGVFQVTFELSPTCYVQTNEYATRHFLFGKQVVSTNIASAMVVGTCDFGEIPFPIPVETPVPFVAVDVFNPFNGVVIKSYGVVAAGPGMGGLLGLPEPVQAGVNAWQVSRRPLKYMGYAYMYTGPGEDDYLKVPFVAEATAEGGFNIRLLESTAMMRGLSSKVLAP